MFLLHIGGTKSSRFQSRINQESEVRGMSKRARRRFTGLALAVLMSFAFLLSDVGGLQAATNNQKGTEDGWDWELWKDYGNTNMTLNGNGLFSCTWSNIGNALFRKGKRFNSSQTHSQLGNISFQYSATYQPNGNSYLCVYGWTVSPLVEFYIVDSWGTWRPPGGSAKGSITVDGGTYDIYETSRINQPSIQGNATFQQYWSVRRSKRTSGTISVSEHFKAWERLGMSMGRMYEVALTVEGYQSSGSASITSNVLTIGNTVLGGGGGPTPTNPPGGGGNTTRVNCNTMSLSGPYAGQINNPFSGVALYGNGDTASYSQYFQSGTHSFTLRGCSNNNNMARVDLYIGGVNKGTFYYGGPNPASYTINNVSHGTGNQQVELRCTADDGTWDAFIQYLEIN